MSRPATSHVAPSRAASDAAQAATSGPSSVRSWRSSSICSAAQRASTRAAVGGLPGRPPPGVLGPPGDPGGGGGGSGSPPSATRHPSSRGLPHRKNCSVCSTHESFESCFRMVFGLMTSAKMARSSSAMASSGSRTHRSSISSRSLDVGPPSRSTSSSRSS